MANITQDTLLSICNSRINKKKVIILTKLGTLVFGYRGDLLMHHYKQKAQAGVGLLEVLLP